MPEVSVIIPTYNPSDDIKVAIQSVLDQDVDVEVIVVDDGSDAVDVAELIREFEGRIQFARQANTGPAGARNRGVALSSAEYTAFLDCDDRYVPDSLSSRLACYKANPSALGVLSMPLSEHEDGSITEWIEFTDLKPGESRPITRTEFCEIGMRCGYFFPNGFLTRKEFFEAHDGLDVTCFGCDEMHLCLKLLDAGELVFLQTPTFVRKGGRLTVLNQWQTRMWVGKYNMVRDFASRASRWRHDEAEAFWNWHDSIIRQCMKSAINKREFSNASEFGRSLKHKFSSKNLVLRAWSLVGSRFETRNTNPVG